MKHKLFIWLCLLIIFPTALVACSQKVDSKMEVIAKLKEATPGAVELFLYDPTTGQEKFYQTLSDVNTQHYHFSENHHGKLYIIRRIETAADWTDELWRYDKSKKATKIFTGKGIDFRVSPDEQYIAVTCGDAKAELVILNSQGKLEKAFSSENQGLVSWSADSKALWGKMSDCGEVAAFFKINIETWGWEEFAVDSLPMFLEYQLNPNTGVLVYSDYPILLDIDAVREFKASSRVITLYVTSLPEAWTKRVAVAAAREFKPSWVDNYVIEYNGSTNQGRIRANINEFPDNQCPAGSGSWVGWPYNKAINF